MKLGNFMLETIFPKVHEKMKLIENTRYGLLWLGICVIFLVISYFRTFHSSSESLNSSPALRAQKSYAYPDHNDGGIIAYLNTLESRVENDENDIEIVAWRSISRHIEELREKDSTRPKRFLDAGCGQGRLLTRFCTDVFAECVGIDADPQRLQQTHSMLSSPPHHTLLQAKVQLYPQGADAFHSDQPFDLILNSMVIQHVANETAAAIIHNLVKRLLPGSGRLVILTTYFPKPTSFYESVNLTTATLVTSPLTSQQFESLVKHPQIDLLPVRLWSRFELESLLLFFGCQIIDHFTFTYHKASSVRASEGKDQTDFVRRHGLSLKEYLQTPFSQGIVCQREKIV